MKRLFHPKLIGKTGALLLTCFMLLMGNNVLGQQGTTVLPNNASYSGKSGPQGALRYQREFYLVTPAEMNASGLGSGMNINSIGFTIARAQNDTTIGKFKVYLQNTSDLVSRADTNWTIVTTGTNEYNAAGLFPGKYEWQVQANCNGNSAFTSSVFFSNDELSGCNNPYNLRTVFISGTGATLTWEAATSPAFVNYLVEYSRIDVINWVGLTVTDTFTTISGLSAGTNYQWRVKTNCSAGESPINYSSFITPAASNCNPPTGLTVSVSNDSLVALNWTAALNAVYYDIQFRRTGTNSWSNASSFTNSANLVLPAGTTYEWQVRTNCLPGPTGDFVPGTNFSTGGTPVCYLPTEPVTRHITGSSATLSWLPVVGATGYTVRYRLKNTISWTNATTGMTLASDSTLSIPDTLGAYDIPFHGGSPFTYTGGGVYIAWEYERPLGALSTANLTLSTTRGTSLPGVNGQDSLEFLLCLVSRADTNMTGLPTILGESKQRPETRLGSNDLKDSVAVVAVYTLGKTTPHFQSPTPISALIANLSATNKTYAVTLTVKAQQGGAIRYTNTQNVAVTGTDSALVNFNGWSPASLENDSIIISIPGQTNENVTNNNTKAYFQKVNASVMAYDDGTGQVAEAGFNTGAGLLLNKHQLNGCGKIIAARIYLTASAKNKPLYAVVRNNSGSIVAQSPSFTPDSSQVNRYHSFYFGTPAAFTNETFYIGLAQQANASGYNPVGAQWEDAETRKQAYYRSNLDGTNLVDYPQQGRLMINAEIIASTPEVFISGNATLCTGATNTLSAGSVQTRFANSVLAFSSQNAPVNYSAAQALGTPNVFPLYSLSQDAWVSATADGQREYLVLGFPNPAPVNFVDIYETANAGAVDSVFVKNPTTLNYELVYSATAAATPPVARKNRISFPLTAFNVSEIRIALNSPAVAGYNVIDAVGIGEKISPATFSSYAWSPGGQTTSSIGVNTPGVYKLTVTNASGCQSTDSLTVVATITTPPVITASGPTAICQGDSVILTSNQSTGNTWSTGATTQSITVNSAGSYTVAYNDGGGCGAISSAAVTVTINPLPTVSITGTLGICPGNQTVLDAGAGFSNYLWNTGETTQTISVSSAGSYSVTVTNSNGCRNSASANTFYITLPAPVITGNLSFCPGGSTVLDAGDGYTSYAWSTGATTRSITVTVPGDYEVTVTNAGGCEATTAVVTSLFATPLPQISGNNGFCAGGSTVLTANAGYNSYLWSTGAITQSITVNTAALFSVTVTDINGCSGTSSLSTQVYPSPNPVIAGTLSFCSGTSTTLNAGAGFSAYLWSTGATTQTINVTTAGTYSVTVTNTNGCTGTASATVSATGGLPVSPGVISGNAIAGCGTSNTYSIAAVPNTTHYVWTVPTGANIISGQGTTSITVSFAANYQGGYIVVAASNACGQSPSIIPRRIFVRSLPDMPGMISGQAMGLCGPVTKTYSIAVMPLATSYTWTVPSGATIVSGQGTTSLTVSFAAGFSFGNLCVTANNNCGSSAARCLTLSGVSPMPGLISGSTVVCSSWSNVSYSVAAVPGATSYTWTVPQSSHINSGQGTNSILINIGSQSGNITVRANSACGSSTVRVKAIIVNSCFSGLNLFSIKPIRPVPEIISNYGGFVTTDKMNIEWTLGEPRVESVGNADGLYTQGFHQPLIYHIPISKTDSSVLVTRDDLKVVVYPNPVRSVLKVKIESGVDRPLVIDLTDVKGTLLQRKNSPTGKELIDFRMDGYAGGAYYLMVKDPSGKIINTIKLVKL